MKHQTRITRYAGYAALVIGSFVVMGPSQPIHAQEQNEKPDQTKTVRPTGGQRDPFEKYKVVVKRSKAKSSPVNPPPIEARIERYKAQKLAAMNAQQPAPKPTTALLLDEMQVIGIFRTPRGTAAMVEATPIKLSYVVYPGESFYNGQLVAIEENRLVFRRETRFSDGHVVKDVETKPLRKPDAVTDSMAASKSGKANPQAAAGKSGEVKKEPADKQ
jgi:hypothetical protein